MFDSNNTRWNQTQPPLPNMTVQVFRYIRGLTTDANLLVYIDSYLRNIGSTNQPIALSAVSTPQTLTNTPLKRHFEETQVSSSV
jgi:hypothetical protein